MIKLTRREYQVIILLARECLVPKEIATRLKISVNTVFVHKENLMKKLDLHTVAEVCRYYWTILVNKYEKR